MEVVSKLLERAVDAGNLRLHLTCFNPRITHLLFADDLLVFLDGSKHSILNAEKSEIFFGGYLDVEAAVISDISGFKIGIFSTRYLGLTLNLKKISYATLQPFLEQITSKLNCWTV